MVEDKYVQPQGESVRVPACVLWNLCVWKSDHARGVRSFVSPPRSNRYTIHHSHPGLKEEIDVVDKVQRIFIMFGLVVLLSACNFPGMGTPEPAPAPPSAPAKFCGDGICAGPENPNNCPEDCVQEPLGPKPTLPIGVATTAPTVIQGEPVLYLGIMVHLEGWEDDQNQAKFEKHVDLLREYADLFESYGAKLTLESKEVTDGILRWGDNVLLEMEERGHGIGVHADIGGQLNYNCDRLAGQLRREREQLQQLGVNVRHVSGNTSHCDWVAATIQAGYVFTTGQVAYSVMSMPVEQRPAEYRDCPSPGECHDTFPPELADRLHPWRASSGLDWLTHDPRGGLVLLASSQVIQCVEEELAGTFHEGCEFNVKDIVAFEGELQEALTLVDPDKVNILYVAWSLGSALDTDLLGQWLASIQPYVEQGQVQWATLPEMYDAYVSWEAGR
jgi:hypothetical protein